MKYFILTYTTDSAGVTDDRCVSIIPAEPIDYDSIYIPPAFARMAQLHGVKF